MNQILKDGRELARACPEGGLLYANDKATLTGMIQEIERLTRENRQYRNLFGPLARTPS